METTRSWLNRFSRPWRRDGALATLGAVIYAGRLLVPPLLARRLVNRVLIGRHAHFLWIQPSHAPCWPTLPS